MKVQRMLYLMYLAEMSALYHTAGFCYCDKDVLNWTLEKEYLINAPKCKCNFGTDSIDDCSENSWF